MKDGKLHTVFLLAGIFALVVIALAVILNRGSDVVHSGVSYMEDVTNSADETIPDAAVPLAAPGTVESADGNVPLAGAPESTDGGPMEQQVLFTEELRPVGGAPQIPVVKAETPEEEYGETPDEPETPAKAA